MNVDDIKTVAVIGAGLIGQAAAVEFALGGAPGTAEPLRHLPHGHH